MRDGLLRVDQIPAPPDVQVLLDPGPAAVRPSTGVMLSNRGVCQEQPAQKGVRGRLQRFGEEITISRTQVRSNIPDTEGQARVRDSPEVSWPDLRGLLMLSDVIIKHKLFLCLFVCLFFFRFFLFCFGSSQTAVLVPYFLWRVSTTRTVSPIGVVE